MSAARSIPASTRPAAAKRAPRSKPAPAQLSLFSRSPVEDERDLERLIENERWASYE